MINQSIIYSSCKEDPSKIFYYIKKGDYSIVSELISKGIVSINEIDCVGNDVLTRLLKAKEYDIVLDLMKKRNWDVNHQNDDGNTFAHILAEDDSMLAVKVMEQLIKKRNFIPNIKNNKNETAMDIALNNHHLCTAFKLLEDKRFNNINIFSFKNLYEVSIKDGGYGKYSKIMNFDLILDSLSKKELDSRMKSFIDILIDNIDSIKLEFMNNRFSLIESLMYNYL